MGQLDEFTTIYDALSHRGFSKRAKKDSYSAGLLFYCLDDRTIFLIRRSKHLNNPLMWDTPGGRSTDSDSSPLETAEREAIEEIGALPTDKQYIGKHIVRKDNDPDYQYHIFAYAIPLSEKRKWTQNLNLDKKESKTHGWYKLNDLPKDTHFRLDWIEDAVKKAHKEPSPLIKLASSIIAPRFEYKYFITPLEGIIIKDHIKAFVNADEHGQFYNISNVYLDNSEWKLYKDHMIKDARFKLRVRFYDNDDQAFFEIKKKANHNITKYRYIVQPSEFDAEIQKGLLPFSKIAKMIGATPKVLINYDREAFASPTNKGERVTIDSNIGYSIANLYDRSHAPDHVILNSDINVLELKFNGEMPQYMQDLVLAYNLQRVPMSKYFAVVSDIIYG
jgi:8-oxo-dGTP pyrophosphatase MutT (NUDIX family)